MKAYWLITILSITLMTTALAENKLRRSETLDRVVAVVNDTIITESDLALNTKGATQQFKAANKPIPNATALRQQVLDRMILDTLQLQIAKRNNMEVSNEDLNKAIQKMADDSHMSLEQLKKAVEHDGLDFPRFRKRINDQMIISRLQQSAIAPKVSITDAEVREYLRSATNKKLGSSEYHLLHIHVPLPESPSAQQIQATEERAKKLVATLKQGADFIQVATNNSSGTEALGGGDLGWRKVAELPTLFANQLTRIKLAEIAGPIRAPNGFHILKLVDVRNDPTKLTEAQVKDSIYRRKFDENLQVWLEQLRDSAYVKKSL
jgi:peptidyl-prolyl cis-trans isomerase SurA